jgi:glycosyltransferase involved in cell wall biosynthesis
MKSKPASKIAIFHAFFKGDCKGGGEKLVLQLRNNLKADLWLGSIDLTAWSKEANDWFSVEAWDSSYKLTYLHEDSKIKFWKQVKRQLYFLFSPKINQLEDYEVIIFSGNIGFIPRRLKYFKGKKIMYCHTPPRPITDQFEKNLARTPFILKPLFKFARSLLIWQYRLDCKQFDIIVANSQNIKNRLQKYCSVTTDLVIPPPVDTARFENLGQKDYYISYARLEDLKRIRILVEAFKRLPDKKLVICSSGPLKDWLEEEIKTHNLKNIEYKGMVSDQELSDLVGNCIAGIYIPENEDAGITQCEIMAAGKPVIGSNEGGLVETIIDGKTGTLIQTVQSDKFLSDEVITQNLIAAVNQTTPEKALSMSKGCQKQGKKYDQQYFFESIQNLINKS